MSPKRFEVDDAFHPGLGLPVVILRDLAIRSEATIVPGLGNNLFSFKMPIVGQPLEVMAGPGQSPAGTPAAGTAFGNPILFPYPNRVRAGRFTFDGRECQLDVPESGTAIHGLVHSLPWEVESMEPVNSGARLVSTFTSSNHPDVLRQYPYPFKLTVTYTLRGDTVKMETEAKNIGESSMPIGFGIHPYFRLPLGADGSRGKCRVRIPADHQWKLGPDLIPTGEVVPTSAERDFQELRELGDVELDDVYTGVQLRAPERELSECVLRDPAAGAEVAVRADPSFREIVVYAPARRPVICFEPYTCATNALNLQPAGIDAGLISLWPGEVWSGTIRFTVRPA